MIVVTRRRAYVALAAALLGAACARLAIAASPRGAGARAAAASPPVTCSQDTKFPGILSVPEASAAAEVELLPGVRELLVVSDSGRNGAALLWRIPSGPARAFTLPLDRVASDDIEGMAWLAAPAGRGAGALYTLTSSGAVRRFVPDGHGGLARDQDAYPLGPAPHACANLRDVNCGRNFEGLCLRPREAPAGGDARSSTGQSTGAARCAGYAASKEASELDCLVFQGDRLAADDARAPIHLARGPVPAGSLSDCAFGADPGPARGTLLVTTNVYGGSTTYLVSEPAGALTALDVSGTLNDEAGAVDRDGSLYLFGDINAALSPGLRFACHGW